MSAAVVRGDALRLPLADESVDLVITSPPYFALRSYRDEGEHYTGQLGSEETPQAFLEALWAVTAECWRVLKSTGSLWVNLGDKYAGSGGHNNAGISDKSTLRGNGHVGGVGKAGPQKVKSTLRNAPDRYNQATDVRSKSLMGLPWTFANGCIGAYPFPQGMAAPDGQRWILRAEVVWSKPNGLPESVTDRVRRSHEQFFHFTKQGRYFAAVDEVREAHNDLAGPPTRFGNITVSGSSRTDGVSREQTFNPPERVYNPLGKLPGSVWTVPSEPLLIPPSVARHYDLPDHFAAFPTEWPRRIILGWSPSGICVECGEGRRPVVDAHNVKSPVHGNGSIMGHRSGGPDERGWDGLPRFNVERHLTGYACACAGGNLEVYPAPRRPAVILDPFGGTGTVAMVARALGRFGVSLDLSADYNRLAKWRIWSSGHGEKAIQRTHKENQGDLFSSPPEPPIEDVVSL